MRSKYTKDCKCSSPFCLLRFKAHICCKTEKLPLKKQVVVLVKKEQCIGDIMVHKVINRGVSSICKPYIDRMMKEDTEIAPKQCHSMLINGNKIEKSVLPKLNQIQGYFRRKKSGVNDNNIKQMIEKMTNQQYYDKIDESEAFFFNIKKTKTGKVLLQNGSPTEHAHIMLTSVALLRRCEMKGVFHIDGTYKLVRNGFPVIVFGVSDIIGTFHPIAFCITSNEQEPDFTKFYEALIKLTNKLDIEFEPEYIMQDACDASYNAAKAVKLPATILMCYFHVMYNIAVAFGSKR